MNASLLLEIITFGGLHFLETPNAIDQSASTQLGFRHDYVSDAHFID